VAAVKAGLGFRIFQGAFLAVLVVYKVYS